MPWEDSPVIAIDTDTTGLRLFGGDRCFGISLSAPGFDVYWDIRKSPGVVSVLREKLKRYRGTVVGHNIKFDVHALYPLGIDLTENNLEDTMLREQLLDEHQFSYSLEDVGQRRLGEGKDSDIYKKLAELFGGRATRNVQMKNLHHAPSEMVGKYAMQDTRLTLRIFQDQPEPPEIYWLEKRVLKVLIKMERLGIRIDEERIDEAVSKVSRIIEQRQQELNALAGFEVNVNSSRDLIALFEPDDDFRLPGGDVLLSTKKGAPCFNAESLKGINHQAAPMVLAIRKYRKILDTFLVSQLKGSLHEGRVHPWFNQCSVVTGRLSCTSPNVQAIPKRDPEMKYILRTLLIPEEGCDLLRCDYEQSDIRGFAHYLSGIVEGHPILEAYKKNPLMDFHQYVADMLGVARNPNTEGPNAKQINLACIFNMGPGKLAKQMGLPYEEFQYRGKTCYKPGPEAKAVFNLYHNKIPGAKEIGEMAERTAKQRGHVRSICGRRLRFPDPNFAYKASGYLYQSFTADLIKQAMVAVSKVTDKLHLQIHDELIISVEKGDKHTIEEVKYEMEHALDGYTEIPIRTSPEIGPNWAETKEIEL